MTRRRHTPEQIVRKLREADRLLGEGQDGRSSMTVDCEMPARRRSPAESALAELCDPFDDLVHRGRIWSWAQTPGARAAPASR